MTGPASQMAGAFQAGPIIEPADADTGLGAGCIAGR